MANQRKFNQEQTQAIEATGNVLVSASAGTGKTTTMIEKIAGLMVDGVSLSEMLILTYTESAGAEMKSRLTERLFELICEASGSLKLRLIDELDNLSYAEIGTIHGFCGKLIKENFSLLGVSPNLKIIDEDTHDVYIDESFEQVFAEYFDKNDNVFLQISDIFAQSRKEENLKSNLKRLFQTLDIQPDPELFISNSIKAYSDFDGGYLALELRAYYIDCIDRILAEMDQLKSYDLDPGFAKFEQNLMSAYDVLIGLKSCDNIFDMAQIADLGFERVNATMLKRFSLDQKQIAIRMKESWKDASTMLQKLAELKDRDKLQIAHSQNIVFIKKMFDIVYRVSTVLAEKKRADEVVSFEDLMRYAGQVIKSNSELALKYKWVFVDEYQDVNPTQEYIISSMIGQNSFIVGDLKQSIYGFRMADPANFLRRQNDCKSGKGSLIYFNKNYRSDQGILNFANNIFSAVMTEKTSDVNYARDAKFVTDDDKTNCTASLSLFQDQTQENAVVKGVYDIEHEEISAPKAIGQEAHYIARTINQLVGKMKTSKGLLSYSDVTILLRDRSSASNQLLLDLQKLGIPLTVTSFGKDRVNGEVEIVNFLRIIDNPIDDFALSAYLGSYFCGFSESELVQIAKLDGENLYQKLQSYSDCDQLSCKIKSTLSLIEEYRLKASFKTVYELICTINHDFCFKNFAKSKGMKAVEEISKLIAFAKTSQEYSIAKFLKKYSLLKPKPASAEVGDNVNVSTYHGYKGLENEVIFMPLMDHAYSNNSQKGDFVVDNNGHLGLKMFDLDNMKKSSSLSEIAIKRIVKNRELKEELRLLYVAVTRAKSRLFMSATPSKELMGAFGELPILLDPKSNLEVLSDAIFKNPNGIGYYKMPAVESADTIQDIVPNRTIIDKDIAKRISDSQNFEYPFKQETAMSGKYSVSSLFQKDEESLMMFEEYARIGTIYHKVMECIDFDTDTLVGVETALKTMVSQNILTDDEMSLVDSNSILKCLKSDIIALAKKSDTRRESKFRMFAKASDVIDGSKSDDKVVVQGVIDLLILGEKNLIVDFKNSKLNDPDIVNKYKKQLYLYKKAVEVAFSVKIDGAVLYSFKTGKEIYLDI